MITELRLPIEDGKPEEARGETVTFVEGTGKPDVGCNEMLELRDSVGKPELIADGNPELGRNEKLRLPVGYSGKPELGPVTSGGGAVELEKALDVKFGTE